MNIINHSQNVLLTTLLLVAVPFSLFAFDGLGSYSSVDTSFSCNDLIHVSLNENCEADISADEIVEGYNGDYNDFTLVVTDEFGFPVGLPISGEYIGEIVTITAIHIPSGISCWGNASIEDKWAPQLSCADYELQCFEDPDDYPIPFAWDNCDDPPAIFLLAETIDDSDLCNGVIITRSYMAVDSSGNESSICMQVFTLQPVPMPDLPRDTSWSCEIFSEYPNVIEPMPLDDSLGITGSGVPDVIDDTYCGYNVVHSDQTLDGCGSTFTIIRTWTVINWCTGEIITQDDEGDDHKQLIKIFDHTPPSIEMEPFTVNANVTGAHPNECVSQDFLPAANVNDICHGVTQRILTPVGEAVYLNGVDGENGGTIPAPGLSLGEHTIIYEATDECGNNDTLEVTITIADLTAPVGVCDEITTVSLDNQGQAEVLAEVFDDGSYDNCCLDSFLVRRMDTECVLTDTIFGETVNFCCADVGDTVMVVFRALDCFGNTNDCMVQVIVEDKLGPSLVECPQPQTIDCGFYTDSLELPLSQGDSTVLEQFGLPIFEDNCEIIFENISVNVNIDQCQQGTIVRNWQVTDPGANGTQACTQTISVGHTSDWVVEFPADVLVTCGDSLPDTGEPLIFFENCELVALSYEDELFTVVPDACFKIVRTWVAVNWCVLTGTAEDIVVESPESELIIDLDLDGDQDERTFQDGLNTQNFDSNLPILGAQPDGYITYQQVIKVDDPTAPIVLCDSVFNVCIFDTSCTADFELPLPDVIDCSIEIEVSAIGDLGSGIGPFLGVPPGDYEMTYQVNDQCGNTGYCQTIVEVVDCKAPTAYCKNGLIVQLGSDNFEVLIPEQFDAGSFDNCTSELDFSFSSDVNDTLFALGCSQLGYIIVEVWVTDEAGNQSYCETSVFIEGNNCGGGPLIAGTLTNALQESIAMGTVNLNGGMSQSQDTLEDGVFEFEVENGEDYTVAPSKGQFPLNGVTTYDLVLISKHILGNQALDNPYKIIAADANLSNSVTTADIVVLRKLILQIETEFPNGNTWRFVDKDFSFPDPLDPFGTSFPEIINLNDVEEDVLDVDFIGVKLGDVNFSADPLQ